MNFSDASDEQAPARDLCGYVVFNYNMLVRNYGGGELDGVDLPTQALFASRDSVFGEHFPDHQQLFKPLCNEHIARLDLVALFARIDSWTKVPPRRMCEPRGRVVGHLVLQEEIPFDLAPQQVAPISEQAAGQRAREKAPMQWHDTLPSLSETRSETFGLKKDEDLPSFHAGPSIQKN